MTNLNKWIIFRTGKINAPLIIISGIKKEMLIKQFSSELDFDDIVF